MKLKYDSEREECIRDARKHVLYTDNGCQVFEFYPPGIHDRMEPQMNEGVWELLTKKWDAAHGFEHAPTRKAKRRPRQPDLFDGVA
jgi:hypothetical protein